MIKQAIETILKAHEAYKQDLAEDLIKLYLDKSCMTFDQAKEDNDFFFEPAEALQPVKQPQPIEDFDLDISVTDPVETNLKVILAQKGIEFQVKLNNHLRIKTKKGWLNYYAQSGTIHWDGQKREAQSGQSYLLTLIERHT